MSKPESKTVTPGIAPRRPTPAIAADAALTRPEIKKARVLTAIRRPDNTQAVTAAAAAAAAATARKPELKRVAAAASVPMKKPEATTEAKSEDKQVVLVNQMTKKVAVPAVPKSLVVAHTTPKVVAADYGQDKKRSCAEPTAFVRFCAKLKVPSFVTLHTLSLSNVVYALSDAHLEYRVKKLKCGKRWQIRLVGSIPYSIEFPASVTALTVDGSLSDWNLVKKGCKRINKVLCTLDCKPNFDVCNVRNVPGFRGFFAESIVESGSSIQLVECCKGKKKHHSSEHNGSTTKGCKRTLEICIRTNLTACADFFAPVTFRGRARCACGPQNAYSVIILDANEDFVARVEPDGGGFWSLGTLVPAGLYIVLYVCPLDTSIVMGVQADVVHSDEFVFPQVFNLPCTFCLQP